ncbi:MAG: hypothetical protein ACR2M4_05140 [Actinomycetota bacterium]
MPKTAFIVKFRLVLGIIVVVALLSTACGPFSGNASKDGQGAPPTLSASVAEKPCLALKKSEVESALGDRVKKGADPTLSGSAPQIPIVGMKFCRFEPLRPAGPFVEVGVTKSYPREVFEKHKADPSAKASQVPGIGDEALWHQFAASHTLVVLKGDTVVGIYLGFVQKDQQQIAINLARKVLSRI